MNLGAFLSEYASATGDLLAVDFVQQALIAAAVLGVLSGVMTPLIVLRQMSFSVHATSELALMGAAAALLFGLNVGWGAIAGSIVAALMLALLGMKQHQDAVIGVVMSFGMGLAVLFIHLYKGNSTRAFSLLTGQIVGVSTASTATLVIVTVCVVGLIVLLWRPLLFASADPTMAHAAGVKLRVLAVIFAVLVGITAAQSVQIVGSLLVMALLITPGASAVQVTASPVRAVVLSVVFAEVAAVGGLILSLAPGVPVSVFVTGISFLIYLICRVINAITNRVAQVGQASAGEPHHAAAAAEQGPLT
ncbi:metal ABC transporter permease [Corynebacterium uropygiale]|uniref:Metal ABC transporter permease n=1 Tax=Corynebacterium uropygiale TaxID=1775911 RepID=A0A9X1QQ93_9CORY|nr:metal ABC transporter permease [Corynebacterium uropygiale]MCF4007151.1 metal ABC transporter permease [Corynebacterium uropygiale]